MSRIEKNINILNLATLFTGIDAVGHGASRVYDFVNHIFACEIDKFARQTFCFSDQEGLIREGKKHLTVLYPLYLQTLGKIIIISYLAKKSENSHQESA